MSFRLTGMSIHRFYYCSQQQESGNRILAKKAVELIREQPTMTFGNLAEKLGINLSRLVSIVVGRLDEDRLNLKHPCGKAVLNGEEANYFGVFPSEVICQHQEDLTYPPVVLL